jgi:hypothetical protein
MEAMIPSARRVPFVYNEEMFPTFRVGREIVSTTRTRHSTLTIKIEKLASPFSRRQLFHVIVADLSVITLAINEACN